MKAHAISSLGCGGGSATVQIDVNGVTVWGRSVAQSGGNVGRKGSFLTKEEAQNLVLMLCAEWGFRP